MRQKILIALALLATAALTVFGLSGGRGAVSIGLLKGQENYFSSAEELTARIGEEVELRFYDSFEDMKSALLSDELDIYVSPLFEHLIHPNDALAVATVPTEYYLAGSFRKDPIPIGVSESLISKILIDHSGALKDRRLSLLRVDEREKEVFYREKIIDFTVFRGKLPDGYDESDFDAIETLSSVGYTYDVLCVKKELLQSHRGLVAALFLSSSNQSHLLPTESEIQEAVKYLFKTGAITERKRYPDYVHIE